MFVGRRVFINQTLTKPSDILEGEHVIKFTLGYPDKTTASAYYALSTGWSTQIMDCLHNNKSHSTVTLPKLNFKTTQLLDDVKPFKAHLIAKLMIYSVLVAHRRIYDQVKQMLTNQLPCVSSPTFMNTACGNFLHTSPAHVLLRFLHSNDGP